MRRRMLALATAAMLSVMVGAGGCAVPSPPDGAPQLRGVIVSAEPGSDGGTVRVVWDESVGEMMDLDSCDVRVGPETEVFDAAGVLADFSVLTERVVVDVWISGPIAESYPPQATADAIEIVGTFDANRPLPIPGGLVEP
ncbi:MAG: DUF3221 domain-containing protein [Clostridiales bacterium]|nr:DUF3221 domain-containing protein [Clostridiales bacterium]